MTSSFLPPVFFLGSCSPLGLQLQARGGKYCGNSQPASSCSRDVRPRKGNLKESFFLKDKRLSELELYIVLNTTQAYFLFLFGDILGCFPFSLTKLLLGLISSVL